MLPKDIDLIADATAKLSNVIQTTIVDQPITERHILLQAIIILQASQSITNFLISCAKTIEDEQYGFAN